MNSALILMKNPNRIKYASCPLAFLLMLLLFFAQAARADGLLPPGNYPPDPIASWSFQDTNFWTSDQDYAPISFSNISWSVLGDGASLVVNAPGSPAYLDYYIYEPTNGATNLVLNSSGGSLDFWYAPNWSSGTNGGAGPGQWTQLIDVGEWSSDSSVGYFGLSVDPSGSNIVFISQDGAGNSYSLSAPISWATNIFENVALTYSSTNVSLYLNGQLVTNDPGGLSVWPPPTEQAVWFGSDTNGNEQAQGLFNSIQTYNVVLDTNDAQQIYEDQEWVYYMNPYDIAYAGLSSVGSNPSTYDFTNSILPDVITGSGILQSDGTMANWTPNANPYYVWITNVVATQTGGGTMSMTFSINGGQSGYLYDVFATSALQIPLSSGVWYWWGQANAGYTYTVTNISSSEVFLILGTPQDTDGDGLTDAYELLVSHSNPYTNSTDGTGMADGWEVLYFGHTGISPTGDPDGDGLSTFQEWLMRSQGYNPNSWNTFTNTLVGDGYQNYSGDGLANLMQASFGGNIFTNNPTWKQNISDDGLSDEYKTMVGLTPGTPTTAPNLPSYSMNPVQ
jgi:hypothetical protein